MTHDHRGEPQFLPFPESPLLPPETAAERWLYGLTRFGMKPGLANIRELVARFDHPERSLRFLHVAGTNGKGSTCHFLDSLLRAAGHRTGLFTSPHLLHVGERLRVAGRPLGEARLGELLALVEGPVTELQATFFETMTLLALLHFREEGVGWVLWETGLGGRLDCTRVVEAEAALLTSIARDHTRYLGDTLEEIAREKLAIGVPGRPFYCALGEGPLLSLARDEAARAGFELRELGALLPWHIDGEELVLGEDTGELEGGASADEAAARTAGGDALRALAGRYALPGLPAAQAPNAALALLALVDLEGCRGETLLPDDPAATLTAPAQPARFDRVRREPPLVLDGAHNPAALAATLAGWDRLLADSGRAAGSPAAELRDGEGEGGGGDERREREGGAVIFGCMEDKETGEMLAALAARPRRVILTAARQGRAIAPDVLREHSATAGQGWESAPDLAAALRLAGEASPILVTGSFYLAAEAYHLLDLDPWA